MGMDEYHRKCAELQHEHTMKQTKCQNQHTRDLLELDGVERLAKVMVAISDLAERLDRIENLLSSRKEE